MSEILRIVYRCLSAHLLSAAHLDKHRARTGAVTFIQRFGGSVNLHIHFHILALDGVYRLDPIAKTLLHFRPVHPPTPNSRKVEAVIHHLGLKVEVQEHDLFAGDLRKPSYTALNRNARAPTLEDGGFVLWESNAIMQYLADKARDERLFPRDPRARADVVRWQCWELAHFNCTFGVLAFETVAKPRRGLQTDSAVVAQAQADLARNAPVLDAQMTGRQFLVGDHVTLADYSMVMLEGYRGLVPFDWSPYTHLNAYFRSRRSA